ncbi:uncharacterized protein LODBEIA_P01500 [Lodderomyces beijingensis]|uniref:CS domain-containing protein n=1 Tax=Lodderomyces beijingensis TaxID=1775926 RepID=A0ABP0ZGF3_9ASCO
MITPFFTITQTGEFIYIDVKISHIRFSAPNIEMTVNNELFIFSLPPYYLRLRLPYPCVDDERAHAEFDSKSECVKIKIPKEIKGQFFPDLDLTAKLLARANEPGQVQSQDVSASAKPMIEELDVRNEVSYDQDLEEGETFDWEVKQEVPRNPALSIGRNDDDDGQDESSLLLAPRELKYGFNNQYDGIIGVSVSNGNDINGLGDPEATPQTDRVIERLIKENIQFDPEIYAADYVSEKYPSEDDDKGFTELLAWKNPLVQKFLKWYKSQQQLSEAERAAVMPVEFTTKEQEQMMNLPRKTYLIDDEYKPTLLLTMICLLFAYEFDARETEGEHNIESAWTIGKIAPQFAFLDAKLVANDSQNKLRAAVITCIRRSLTFPYHRSFALSKKVWDDVYYILRGGKRLVLKALLDLKELFRFHDIYYVYDKIWMEDLCAYLVSDNVSEGAIRNLAHDLKKEVANVSELDITFEKSGASATGDGDDIMGDDATPLENEDEMVVLSLKDIQDMVESSYQSFSENNNNSS